MRAAVRDRYGDPEVVRVAEVPTPTPQEGEVLVEVVAASLNTADLDHLRGSPLVARLGTGLRRPRSPRMGLDVAGRVVDTGPEVSDLRPGDRVWADLFSYGHGAFAHYVSAPAEAFSPIPDGVGFEEAATVPHSGLLALQGLNGRGPVREGEKVLINGAGGCVGPFAIQIAHARGAEVTAVDHADKLSFVRGMGAERAIDYTRQDFTLGGEHYDLILDIAESHPLRHYRRALAPNGRYVLIAHTLRGFARAALLGGRRMGVFAWAPNRRRDLDLLGELIAEGRVHPVIHRRFRLEEVRAALGFLADGHARGKLIVAP
ncbi:MAG: NAD(P)-dependent alcohol dehydrogenase [Actinomycetota bacterium]